MEYITKMLEEIKIRHEEAIESAIMAEVKQIGENHIETTLLMNPLLIKSAILKQMPKKPIMGAYPGFHVEEAARATCPNCGRSVINYFIRSIQPPYCMMCGQRLDWIKEAEE